ncbi:DNA pilot protein [Blackfly microvirus SF02]|uniref:DNA pilot protein n=1 Tax=Blackfly microvirus SF02 TaxID=2576452 RepID=A0A4P8PU87_9VIRU|nr:DNA pilot protein [Blackfly microvirus SF02]
MLDFIGSLIGAGAKIFGGQQSASAAEKIAQENIANQRDVAQNRIQWTVQDAEKAGINPLAALGNATQSYSNVVGSDALGSSIGDAGQSLGRAVAAMAPVKLRNAELENQLLEAKIKNMDSDTVSNMKAASDQVTKLGQPGTAVPFPTPDPRGAVINLMQRARDPRTGEIVWIPSKDAASPLQTLAALPTNAALAGRGASEGLIGFDGGSDSWMPFRGVTGAVGRAVQNYWRPPSTDYYSPY